jgi:hypothetical protein
MILKENNASSISFKVVRRSKIYDKNIKLHNVEHVLFSSGYIDRYSNQIYDYDILHTTKIISDSTSGIESVNNYFMCFRDERKQNRFDILYFSYNFMNFVWFDDYLDTSRMTIIGNGINITNTKSKAVKHSIPNFMYTSIETMINKTNIYFHE